MNAGKGGPLASWLRAGARPVLRPRVRSGASWRPWPGVLIALACTVPAAAAEPTEATVAAWTAYVSRTETRIDERLAASGRFLVLETLPAGERRAIREAALRGEVPIVNVANAGGDGDGLEVPDGMIHHWRGWLFIPDASVSDVLRGIVEPDGPRAHAQEDVLEVRLLERRPEALRLFLKLQRRRIVTVTYNTEHAVQYRMHGVGRASSRSVATRIRELADAGTPHERERRPHEDRGFLWGMNSYWRYQALPGGVLVEMESVTLSRDLPWGVGAIVRPLIDSVARESVQRTMLAIRARFDPRSVARREDPAARVRARPGRAGQGSGGRGNLGQRPGETLQRLYPVAQREPFVRQFAVGHAGIELWMRHDDAHADLPLQRLERLTREPHLAQVVLDPKEMQLEVWRAIGRHVDVANEVAHVEAQRVAVGPAGAFDGDDDRHEPQRRHRRRAAQELLHEFGFPEVEADFLLPLRERHGLLARLERPPDRPGGERQALIHRHRWRARA